MDSYPEVTRALYTTKETCVLLAVSRPQLQTFVNRGWIVPVREGRWVRFSRAEISRFVVNMQRRAQRLPLLPPAVTLPQAAAYAEAFSIEGDARVDA